MRRHVFAAGAALVLALGGSGCGKEPCEKLAAALCDPAPMKPCMSFVELQMEGPDGARLTEESREEACKLIQADDKLLALYRDRWKRAQAAADPNAEGPGDEGEGGAGEAF